MHTEEYMLPEFLNKVKVLKIFIQHKYNQYKMYQHLKKIIVNVQQ